MYQSLQGGRAFAAAIVVLFHLGGTFAQQKYFGAAAFDRPFMWGDAGVEFFFVLSGFLITFIHRRDFGRPGQLSAYLFKRTVRIYPTYWVICLAVCSTALVIPSLRQALPSDPITFLVALTLVPMDPALVGGTGSPILFVAWSLQYEMMFYAIVAATIVSRALGCLFIIGVLAVAAGCHLGATCGFPQSFVASNMVFLFAMGVATAYIAKSAIRVPVPVVLAVAATMAFVGFGVFEIFNGRDSLAVDRRFVYGVISCFVILGFVRAEDDRSLVVKHRWLQILGDSSYALYLIHIPIISALVKVFSHRGIASPVALTGVFVFVFVACVLSAIIFHVVIERPLLRWLRSSFPKAAKQQSPVGPQKESGVLVPRSSERLQ